MSNITVVLNRDQVGEYLQSEELEQALLELAQSIADRCGEGYAADTYQAGSRVIASVYTETGEAALDNEQNNTILRCLE